MTFRASFRFDIRSEWEEAIRKGQKTIDVRINVQPYADVKKGDIIRYHSLKVTVKKIRAYPDISDLLAYEDYRKVVPEAKNFQEALKILREEFPHIEQPHGILAFEIENI
ncbi:MAG: ASCH domain-containing protein, partial [Nitrospirota bacterium]